MTAQDHHKISPTAKLVAKIRADYTDIPYAREVYEQIQNRDGEEMVGPVLKKIALLFPSLRLKASGLEGRYVSINDALARLGNCSILEVAAGVSPRGLDYSRGGRLYVETDLPEMIKEKEAIVKAIRAEEGVRLENHCFMPVNVLEWEDMQRVGELVREKGQGKEIAIVFEGLFGYFEREEKMRGRDIFARFLREYSPYGAVVTTDFSSRGVLKGNLIGTIVRRRMEKKTGRKFSNFESYDEAGDFAGKAGLRLKVLPNRHLVEGLSCLKKLHLNVKSAEGFAENYQACFLTLA